MVKFIDTESRVVVTGMTSFTKLRILSYVLLSIPCIQSLLLGPNSNSTLELSTFLKVKFLIRQINSQSGILLLAEENSGSYSDS